MTLPLLAALLLSTTLLQAHDPLSDPVADRDVDIGGHTLRVRLTGGASAQDSPKKPTVILEGGLGNGIVVWQDVQPVLSQFTRVLSYDRAGVGESPPGPLPRTPTTVAGELHSLLAALHLQPPYVLVGHSAGGFHVRAFAAAYPDEMAALVLVDATPEQCDGRFRAWDPERFQAERQSIEEYYSNWPEGIQAEWRAARSVLDSGALPFGSQLPDVPTVILTSTSLSGDGEWISRTPAGMKIWIDLHRNWTHGLSNVIHVLTDKAGHYIHTEFPELVIAAIVEACRVAAHGGPLTDEGLLDEPPTPQPLPETTRADQNPTDVLRGHKKPVRLVSFSPDSSLLASAAWDDSTEHTTELKFWDATTGTPIGDYGDSALAFTDMAFSPDGLGLQTRSLSQQGPRHVAINLLTGNSTNQDITDGSWDAETGEPITHFEGHDSDVLCVALSPDGQRMAAGTRDGLVRLWDNASLEDGRAASVYREAALPRLEERVARALTESEEPVVALHDLLEGNDVSPREREIMIQIALGFGLRRQAARRAGERAGLDVAAAKPTPMAPSRYGAPRATAPLIMDGQLDEADWSRAPWTTPFVDIEGAAKPLPTHDTRVRMLWDNDFLYVAAELTEPHVWAAFTEHDSIIYRENDFEVFLDPEGDGLWYGEIEINALGTVFDLQLDKAYQQGGHAIIDWTPADLRSAVTIQGTLNDPTDIDVGWTVEMAIPHSSLAEHATTPIPPGAGDVWRINFSRVQWQHDIADGAYVKRPHTPENNWVWTPQFAINMHKPRHWGFVEFLPAD